MENIAENLKTKVGITGSTGFIGKNLSLYLTGRGFKVIPLERGFEIKKASGCDVIINLAGASIDKRWSKRHKREIINSRTATTQRVCEAISKSNSVKLLLNASAVGIYKHDNHTLHTEESQDFSDTFLGDVCRQWEREAMKVRERCKVVIMRLGVVMSTEGGALKKISLPAKTGIATVVGDGKQYISWIMLDDLLNAIHFTIQHNTIDGIVNMTSPEPITNLDLTRIISKRYKSLFTIKIPEIFFRLLMGEGSQVVLKGVKVLPSKLMEAGFNFENRAPLL